MFEAEAKRTLRSFSKVEDQAKPVALNESKIDEEIEEEETLDES